MAYAVWLKKLKKTKGTDRSEQSFKLLLFTSADWRTIRQLSSTTTVWNDTSEGSWLKDQSCEGWPTLFRGSFSRAMQNPLRVFNGVMKTKVRCCNCPPEAGFTLMRCLHQTGCSSKTLPGILKMKVANSSSNPPYVSWLMSLGDL